MKKIRYLTLLWMLFCGIMAWAQDFDPQSPVEPGQLTYKLKLNVSPEGAGSVSSNVGLNIVPNGDVTVTANPSTGWEFVNWTDEEGTEVSTNKYYSFKKAAKTETLTANFRFNPDGPSEPNDLPHQLELVAEEGGSVSGGGYYLNGASANIYAYPGSNYEFAGWYRADGTLYSSDASTTYTMGTEVVTLTAKFTFNPDSPVEPDEVNLWRLKLTAQTGGSVSAESYSLKVGETVTVYAYPSSGYVFAGWYQGETKVSEETTLEYTMPESNVTLEARFEFSPSSPGEPGYIEQRKFSFTLNNVITKPGTTVEFPILLTPLATIGNITFQLNFDPRLDVDISNVQVAETSTAYTLTTSSVTESDETYDAGFSSYKFTLTGGSMVVGESETPTVTPILTFPITIPSDFETGISYRITINQIIITKEDGTTQTAGTKNGRVSVYKNGDANGDNTINVSDYIGVANNILNIEQSVFIKEASDVNDDETINVSDYIGVANIILYGDVNGNASARQEKESKMETNVEPE